MLYSWAYRASYRSIVLPSHQILEMMQMYHSLLWPHHLRTDSVDAERGMCACICERVSVTLCYRVCVCLSKLMGVCMYGGDGRLMGKNIYGMINGNTIRERKELRFKTQISKKKRSEGELIYVGKKIDLWKTWKRNKNIKMFYDFKQLK